MRNTRLTEVAAEAFELAEPQPPQVTPAQIEAFENKYTNLLASSLQALSHRATVALASLFLLLLAGSAFWLWLSIMPSPTVMQLIGVGMYSIFVLALEIVRRRK